jgi:hypothetical protein
VYFTEDEMTFVEPYERRVGSNKLKAAHALTATAVHDEVILAAIDKYSSRSPSTVVEDLRGRAHEATIQLELASAEFASVARQPVGGDRGKRLESADRAVATARQALLQTLTEFSRCLMEDTIPLESRSPVVLAKGAAAAVAGAS